MIIKFEVLGDPVPKGRPRFAMRGRFPHTYTPKKTVEFEELVKWKAMENKPKELILSGVVLQVDFHIRKPAYIKTELVIIPHTKKPDCSNLVKCIEDAMNDIIYKDDGQIWDEHIRKFYALIPKTIITIEWEV